MAFSLLDTAQRNKLQTPRGHRFAFGFADSCQTYGRYKVHAECGYEPVKVTAVQTIRRIFQAKGRKPRREATLLGNSIQVAFGRRSLRERILARKMSRMRSFKMKEAAAKEAKTEEKNSKLKDKLRQRESCPWYKTTQSREQAERRCHQCTKWRSCCVEWKTTRDYDYVSSQALNPWNFPVSYLVLSSAVEMAHANHR